MATQLLPLNASPRIRVRGVRMGGLTPQRILVDAFGRLLLVGLGVAAAGDGRTGMLGVAAAGVLALAAAATAWRR